MLNWHQKVNRSFRQAEAGSCFKIIAQSNPLTFPTIVL
jgi:hypothetical protein